MKRVLLFILCFMLIFSIPFSYSYWANSNMLKGVKKSDDEAELTIGTAVDSLDRLPINTPDYVREQLDKLQTSPDVSNEILDKLVDAIIGILESMTEYENYEGRINIAADVDGLFEDGATISGDNLLIYISENEDGSQEVMIVHVNPESSYSISKPEDIYYALERPWTGINQISSIWLRGNLYTTYNSPLEYRGKYYLMYHDGPSGTPPSEDRNTWFEMNDEYSYNQINKTYFANHIVWFNNAFYIASAGTWGTAPSASAWCWDTVQLWSSGSYANNTVVRTFENDDHRFWRSLVSNNTSIPSEASARAGQWREISNGWIGQSSEQTILCHYFEYNTYNAGDIIIFGVTSKLKYRYFIAKKAVPADTHPMTFAENGWVLNEEFWESY